jgi:hypothetical protein
LVDILIPGRSAPAGPVGGEGQPPPAGRSVRIAPACWLLLLGGVVPILAISRTGPGWSLTLIIVVIITLHSALALTRVLVERRVSLLHLGFWAYCYLFFGLAGLAQISSAINPTAQTYPASVSVPAVLIVEFGQLAFSLGSFAGRRWHPRRRSDRFERILLDRELSRGRVLALCGVAVLATVYAVPHLGGISTFFTSRQAANEALSESDPNATGKAASAIITWGVCVPALFAALGLLHTRAFRRRLEERSTRTTRTRIGAFVHRFWRAYPLYFWVLLAAMLGLNVVVNNPISQPRFWAGTVLLSLAFTPIRMHRPAGFRFGAIVFLVLFIVVFPYSSYFRYTKTQAVSFVSLSSQLQDNLDYDSLAQVQTGVEYVDKTGFHPDAVLGPVAFFVPRSVWPHKPEDTGVVLSQYVGYTLTNRSAPLWIESYQWGGPLVVGVVFALLGYLWRRIDNLFDAARDGYGRLIHCAVPVLAFFQIIVLRGSLLQATAPLVLVLVIPLLLSRRVGSTRSLVAPAPARVAT